MKVDNIHIVGIGGIRDLRIKFDANMNIVCGPNGIGKTTLLECIAHCFTNGNTKILKKNVNSDLGFVESSIFQDDEQKTIRFDVNNSEPNKEQHIGSFYQHSKYVLSLKTTRTFSYVPLQAVSRDTEKAVHILWNEAQNGIPLGDIKNWFVNRYLYSAHPGALKISQVENFELAKSCFSKLNGNFSFARVDAATNEIMVSTPSGFIFYEYLSSGFKSCLAILFGIIKEIEFRFGDIGLSAKKFDGVVLIDELELHLHPDWQTKIAQVLSEVFPSIQFIVTTHSPHIIQSANANQIKALEFNNESDVVLRDLPNSSHGFKMWTIDEVLTDVMGMIDTRTNEFKKLIDSFGLAVDSEDCESAKSIFNELDSSLHPDSTVRKLLKIQLESVLRD